MAGDGGGGGHLGADEVGAAAAALAAFEVAVGGGGAAFAGLEDVGVHSEAHGAAGLAPVEAGVAEDFVEAFALGLCLDLLGAGDDHGADGGGDVVTAHDLGGGAEVFYAGVGAGAEEDGVDFDFGNGHAGLEVHVFEGSGEGFAVGFGEGVFGAGDGGLDGGDHSGRGAPGDTGGELGGVQVQLAVEDCSWIGYELGPVVDGGLPGVVCAGVRGGI